MGIAIAPDTTAASVLDAATRVGPARRPSSSPAESGMRSLRAAVPRTRWRPIDVDAGGTTVPWAGLHRLGRNLGLSGDAARW